MQEACGTDAFYLTLSAFGNIYFTEHDDDRMIYEDNDKNDR
jgi:hypothetical protein